MRLTRLILTGLNRMGCRGFVVLIVLAIVTRVALVLIAVMPMVVGLFRFAVMIPVFIFVAGRLMIPIPNRALSPRWPMIGTVIVSIPMLMRSVAFMAGIKIGDERDEVGPNPVSRITDIARVIRIDRIAGRIKSDFAMGHAFRSIDREFETAIERQLRANDLLGIGGALHQIIAAVNIAFGDEIADDILAAFVQLLVGQLMGIVDQGEQRRRAARCRLLHLVRWHDAARAQEGENTEQGGQNEKRNFHENGLGHRQ